MIHPTAVIAQGAYIGKEAKIWHFAQVREGAMIGAGTIVGGSVYIDVGVYVGRNCKIQSGALLFHGVVLEDGVFVGPGVIMCNDKIPRAINPNGTLKEASDWLCLPVIVHYGASIGAGSVILPGVEIGEWAMIGAGSVVTENVPKRELWYGNPARCMGCVDEAGNITARLVWADKK